MRKLILLLVTLFFSQLVAAVPSPEFTNGEKALLVTDHSASVIYLAAKGDDRGRQPESGDLVIPGEEEKQAKEKQCLTVCKEWGEDCIINPRTGARKCRRTCKQFGEECF